MHISSIGCPRMSIPKVYHIGNTSRENMYTNNHTSKKTIPRALLKYQLISIACPQKKGKATFGIDIAIYIIKEQRYQRIKGLES